MSLLQYKNSGVLGLRRFSQRELLLVAVFAGFSSGIIQVLLIREILTMCRGNELIIGVIYASWFFGIYSGARFSPPRTVSTLQRRIYILLLVLPVIGAISIYLPHFTGIIFPRITGTFYTFSTEIFFAFLFTYPSGFLTGLFFPALVSLISSDIEKRSGGMVFSFEAFGSFAGGMVFSFIFVEHINPAGITSILLLFAVITVFINSRLKLVFFAVIPSILILFSDKIENSIIAYTWNRTHTGKFVEYKRTKFGAVTVETSADTVSIYGDGIFLHNLPDRYESRGIFHLIRSLRDDRSKLLLYGSGTGSLLHNLSRSGSGILYYFDTDPSLWKILLPYTRACYGETAVVPGDELKHYLKNSSEKFGMIVSIPPEPENIMINRFYTMEFFALCRSRLDDNGIFITALHGFSNYMSADKRNYIASIYKAFRGEFPVHIKTSGGTIYLIGAKNEAVLPSSPEILVSRYGKLSAADRETFEKELMENFSSDELLMFFEKTQLRYFDSTIVPVSEKIEPNSDIRPGAYWRNILLSAFRERSFLYNILKSLFILPAIIIFLSIIALYDIFRKHGISSMIDGALIYITGFVSISIMLIMVLLYQKSSGIVYHHISLINSLFMLGLGAGSFVFSRQHFLKLHNIFFSIMIIPGFVYYLTIQESSYLFWIIIPIFSFLCGSVFPLLFSINSCDYYTSASIIDSMDNFGAIAGSLLTVLYLVPLFGIQMTIIVNTLLLFIVFIYLILFRKRY